MNVLLQNIFEQPLLKISTLMEDSGVLGAASLFQS